MNVLSRRAGARAGVVAAALLAVGAVAAPAYADDTADLEITFTGTTIAADASGKFGAVSLVNHGPSAASGILVTLDVSALDKTKVTVDETGCDPEAGGKILCGIEGDVIANGADVDWFFPLVKATGATGAAGKVTATIEAETTDPNPANNTVTVDVSVGGSGADLSVVAPDVYQWDATNKEYTNKPVVPGGTSRVLVFVENDGDQTATGIKLTITLPAHVTFTETEPDCTHKVGDSTTTCEYADAELIPADQDKDPAAAPYSWGGFWWSVKVADDVASPSTLTGGTATADAMAVPAAAPMLLKSVPTPPENFIPGTEVKDVDPTDNTDDFSVFVANDLPPASGGGG
ncbi:MAG TPA: hypothetical protein VFE14_14010, partial [Micromonosporaceae bacterium]|nr:hypothetical protein [Micromonosporaceae bacterium]